MFMRTKSEQNVCYWIFVLKLCKSKLDIFVSTNLLFLYSIMDFILNNITLYTSLECDTLVSISNKNVFQRTSWCSLGPILHSRPLSLWISMLQGQQKFKTIIYNNRLRFIFHTFLRVCCLAVLFQVTR
jgi:hypothetical protein